jgi:hypothetical protein
MSIWKLDFKIHEYCWTNEVTSIQYRTLKKDIDMYLPEHRYQKLDFIPQEENKEDGLFTIINDIKPIGTLEITLTN